MIESRFEAYHLCSGKNLVQCGDDPPLRENPEVWRQLWDRHRDTLLNWWIREHPGSRPEAHWLFDHDMEPPEDEREYLAAHGLLTQDDIDGIRRKALELIRHNAVRDPSKPSTNFIPDRDGLLAFAQRHGLLTPERHGHVKAATGQPGTAGTRGRGALSGR
jgi:hypothetical protein